MNNDKELVFAKGKDGHYRYVSRKELKKQLRPVRFVRFLFYLIILSVVLGGGYYLFTDLFEVYLVQEEVLIDSGSSYQIELLPKNSKYFDYNNYVYESDNKEVVSIDNYGQITAVSNGTANVSVRYKYGIEKKTMKVAVRNIEVSSLSIDNKEISKNDTEKAEVKVNNQDNLSTSLNYKSSDESVIKVDDNGNLVGVDEGKATITVEGPDGVKEEKTIEVKTTQTEIQDISIKENNVTLKKGKTKKLTLVVVPSDASVKGVKWTSNTS